MRKDRDGICRLVKRIKRPRASWCWRQEERGKRPLSTRDRCRQLGVKRRLINRAAQKQWQQLCSRCFPCACQHRPKNTERYNRTWRQTAQASRVREQEWRCAATRPWRNICPEQRQWRHTWIRCRKTSKRRVTEDICVSTKLDGIERFNVLVQVERADQPVEFTSLTTQSEFLSKGAVGICRAITCRPVKTGKVNILIADRIENTQCGDRSKVGPAKPLLILGRDAPILHFVTEALIWRHRRAEPVRGICWIEITNQTIRRRNSLNQWRKITKFDDSHRTAIFIGFGIVSDKAQRAFIFLIQQLPTKREALDIVKVPVRVHIFDKPVTTTELTVKPRCKILRNLSRRPNVQFNRIEITIRRTGIAGRLECRLGRADADHTSRRVPPKQRSLRSPQNFNACKFRQFLNA